MNRVLTPELEEGIIKNLIIMHFGEEKADALLTFVVEVLSYRDMPFSKIIDELHNVDICESCGEATYWDFLVDTEGLPNGGYGVVCDYCYGNGK